MGTIIVWYMLAVNTYGGASINEVGPFLTERECELTLEILYQTQTNDTKLHCLPRRVLAP